MSLQTYMNGMTYSLPKPIAEEQRPFDWRYQIMEMSSDARRTEINTWDREKIIYWLEWNDPNGIYSDADSIAECYPILTLDTTRELIFKILAR